MKIKLYIVTYKKNDILNKNLESLWENTNDLSDIDITILSNHPSIEISKKWEGKNLRIILNTTRIPDAWGYLSRDWNFCILDAFKNWKNPNNVDWCVLAQNDVTWKKDWDVWVRKNKKYDFVSRPTGDQCLIFNIEAIKKIGFFDETFTTLHFHEIDYFIRANINCPEKISITDVHVLHNFSINPVNNIIIDKGESGINEDDILHNTSNHMYSLNRICKKYNFDILQKKSAKTIIDEIKRNYTNMENNWYPFFWKDYVEMNFMYDCLNREKILKKPFIYKILNLLTKNKKNNANIVS